MNVLITKIPPNLPLPKGGIYRIFIPLCVPKAHEGLGLIAFNDLNGVVQEGQTSV